MILWENSKNDGWEYIKQRNRNVLCGVLEQGGSKFSVRETFMQQRMRCPLNKNDGKDIFNKWSIHKPPAAFQEERIQVSLDVGEK